VDLEVKEVRPSRKSRSSKKLDVEGWNLGLEKENGLGPMEV
jgi:hypothetical protein